MSHIDQINFIEEFKEFYIKNNFSWKELQRLDKYRENYLKKDIAKTSIPLKN